MDIKQADVGSGANITKVKGDGQNIFAMNATKVIFCCFYATNWETNPRRTRFPRHFLDHPLTSP
ncbi:hypothetical protein [Thioalkalivibrio sp. HK1]|uniref:hypothetical protein n=1 Tax=Thioalkalivibrio sp. HK1 TaxID=1469245 RepID=UPI0018CC2992|nr:hypothetical protein [Thioalkalivibrio sp. HK1]